MNNNRTFVKFLIVAFVMLSFNRAEAFVKPAVNSEVTVESVFELTPEVLIEKDKKDLEEEIGRKLTFKEKLALPFVKKKLKKHKKLSSAQAAEGVKTDGLAIAGFVLGVIGIFIAGLILGILAIIFGGIALGRIRRNPETRRGKGFAIAALVLGIVSILGALVFLALFFG